MTRTGNRNALKHGIYSRFITVDDETDIAPMSDKSPAAELALARARLANALREGEAAKDQESKLNWDHAAQHWLEIILTAKTRIVDNRQTEAAIWTSLIDAVRAANDVQVKK